MKDININIIKVTYASEDALSNLVRVCDASHGIE